jgi:hypothetical protein
MRPVLFRGDELGGNRRRKAELARGGNYIHVENVLSLTRSILTLEGKECADGNHRITGRSLADSPFDALTVG